MPVSKGLTELENCALGVVRHRQPCSTYEVRRIFARSTTTEWSASAGSIYPVIERLLGLKLVRVAGSAVDGRGRRDMVVTKKGERALHDWILNLEQRTARATPDPIRTRAYFLDYLRSGGDRAAFIEFAEELTKTAVDELQRAARTRRTTAVTDYLAATGALFQLQARLKWLRMVRRVTSRAVSARFGGTKRQSLRKASRVGRPRKPERSPGGRR